MIVHVGESDIMIDRTNLLKSWYFVILGGDLWQEPKLLLSQICA